MAHDAVQQFRVVRELCRVFECESGGAFGGAIDDESRDLEDLALAPNGGLRLLLRGAQKLLRGRSVARAVRYHRVESGGDRVRGAG
jgi:hypothetical protein